MINLKQTFLGLFKPEPKDKNEYLEKLVHNLKEVKNSNSTIPFTIQELKLKGFLIKTGGLFGFISFAHMPWHYNNNNNWQNVAPYLIGHRFFCSVYSIKTNPIQIIVDGKAHKFHSIDLEEGTPYNAVIVQKTSYGLFLEVGYNFEWKYGSIIGLAHQSTFFDTEEFENSKQGDTITTYFHGYTADKKILLGDTLKEREWWTGELNNFLGTIQKVTITKNDRGKNDYLIQNKYTGILTISKTIYPEKKSKIKRLVSKLNEGEVIECEIVGLNKLKKKFQLKLTDKYLVDKT